MEGNPEAAERAQQFVAEQEDVPEGVIEAGFMGRTCSAAGGFHSWFPILAKLGWIPLRTMRVPKCSRSC